MKRSALIAAAFSISVSGCASSKIISGPDGEPAYFIKCGSAVISACYEEAARVCPSGYDMLSKDNNPNAFALPVGTGFMIGRGPNTMFIRCR